MIGHSAYIQVNNRPFFILGGQVHNSSAYTPERMGPLWRVLRGLGANTAEVPIYWEQVEPREGELDWRMLDALIDGARENDLRLVLLWFATWKNGVMKNAPAWVKRDPARFPRVIAPDGGPLAVLSPLGNETLSADRRAFVALLSHLQEVDGDHRTVIMVQVQNEPGSLGADRDYAPEANALFSSDVPHALMGALESYGPGSAHDGWEAHGRHASGSWERVFGRHAAKVFSAWHTASYIGAIARAGKEVYDLPLYVNVWLKGGGFQVPGYDYPAGGAVEGVIDVWKTAAPAVDIIAPDIYAQNSEAFRHACAVYARPDNPLLIPECGVTDATARHLFYAIADHGAIGVAPFGIDNTVDAEEQVSERARPIADAYASIRALLPLVCQHRTTGRMHAIVQEEGTLEQFIALEGCSALVDFGKGWYGRPTEGRGRGLLIQAGPREFYVTGSGFTVYIRPDDTTPRWLHRQAWQGRLDPWIAVDGGRFVGDTWVAEEPRSGDESDYGLVTARPDQAVRAILGEL